VIVTFVSPLGATWGSSWHAAAAAMASNTGNRLREIIVDVLMAKIAPWCQPFAMRVMM
jgi:hypothetical protein